MSATEAQTARCESCGRDFTIRFGYQWQTEAGRDITVCSAECEQRRVRGEQGCRCEVCGAAFELEYPFQMVQAAGGRRTFCSTGCREDGLRPGGRSPQHGPRRIAVFNHKGGTGKTTTAVNLAAGLAAAGDRVLLVDADGQGNVGASLGIRGEQTLYHVLVEGTRVDEVAVPVRNGLDVLTSNELVAAAELYLGSRPARDRVMRDRLADRAGSYDVVVVDCAPALSLMNQNALVYADELLVPVSCDYLSLVGVRQVVRTLKSVRELLDHESRLSGILPTFFDVRNRIARDALETLRNHFGERCLPPIRVNTRLREAPSAKQTIFEYAPRSHGANDYRALVEHVKTPPKPAAQAATGGQAVASAEAGA